MKIVACNSNRPLAESVAEILEMPLTKASIRRFADMEVFVEIHENVRGEDVFVMQSTSFPANDNLMELLITLDALRRASARRITAVIPYFGYARQDRKSGSRTPISAKLVANLITEAGAHRVLTMDLHAGQIQGFFDIPVDNLYRRAAVQPRHPGAFRRPRPDDRLARCRRRGARASDRHPAELRPCHHRQAAGAGRRSEVMNVIGDVVGRDCILVDDLVDSGGTHCNAADALIKRGARSASAYVTHGVLSGAAVARIAYLADRDDDDHRLHPGDRRRSSAARISANSPSRRCWPRRCAASATKAPSAPCSTDRAGHGPGEPVPLVPRGIGSGCDGSRWDAAGRTTA